jgi:hypothetical protein
MTANEHSADKEKKGNGHGLFLRLSTVLKKTTKNPKFLLLPMAKLKSSSRPCPSHESKWGEQTYSSIRS